jgi:hypothetical protein
MFGSFYFYFFLPFFHFIDEQNNLFLPLHYFFYFPLLKIFSKIVSSCILQSQKNKYFNGRLEISEFTSCYRIYLNNYCGASLRITKRWETIQKCIF